MQLEFPVEQSVSKSLVIFSEIDCLVFHKLESSMLGKRVLEKEEYNLWIAFMS
jgi:hypothetical protein